VSVKPLTLLQIKAIALLAQGSSEHEVADALGKSRSWVQTVKRHPEYRKIKNTSVDAIAQAVVEQVKQSTINDLEEIRNRFKLASDVIFESAYSYLQKIHARIQSLEASEDISPQRLAQSLKLGAESIVIALDLSKANAGLDEVIQQIDEIVKPD
jgi:transcriptional regulator